MKPVIAERYSLSMATTVSGSWVSLKAVKPRMSLKRMVACTRRPDRLTWPVDSTASATSLPTNRFTALRNASRCRAAAT